MRCRTGNAPVRRIIGILRRRPVGHLVSLPRQGLGRTLVGLSSDRRGLQSRCRDIQALGYRSFGNYASDAKAKHIELGYAWTDQLDQLARWTARSVARGQGPPKQSAPLEVNAVVALDGGLEPLVPSGPVCTQCMFLLSTMYVLRKIEVAGATLSEWAFDHQAKERPWALLVSKTDPSAKGIDRR